MKLRNFVTWATLLLGAASFSARAMDIDLFMTDNQNNTSPANVMFLLDNSANWTATLYKTGGVSVTKLDVLSEALYQALTDPANTDTISTGFTQFTSKSGGKVTAAVKPLTSLYQRTLGAKIYNASPWTANTSMVRPVSGKIVTPIYVLPNYSSDTSIAPNNWNGHYYSVTTDGTTGATEPVWPTTGGSVTSGTVVLKDMGSVYGATAIQALTQANGASYALAMYEDYLYFRGDAPLNGLVDGVPTSDIYASGAYVSPNKNQTCEKNFIVLLGNGSPDSGENNSAYSVLSSLYKSYGISGNPTVIPLNPNYSAGNWADEYAGFFHSTGDANKVEGGQQPITTFVIAIYPATGTLTPVDQGAIAFLKNIAEMGGAGGSGYFQAGDTAALGAALRDIFNQVKAVNSVFASTTLPVSINVRGTNLNQVYMGVFRPDANKAFDWYGNLKMYKLGLDTATGATYLADANGNRADSAVTGFINSNAASFWTHQTDSSVYKVSDYPTDTQWWWWRPTGVGAKSDYVDGDLVEKGGAGQWLREHPAARKLYTCHTCTSGTALQNFDTTHVTASDLGVNSTDAAATVNFIIGSNAVGDGKEQVRSLVHGDVLHSRPATINYGPSTDDVVVYYGANDGVFHAVKGGEANASWGYSVGQEIWGFVPPELYTNLPKLYYNQTISGSNPKPFFVDGTIAALTWDQKNYIFLTMRRGARAIYALNVADNVGQAPTVAWHLNNNDLPELGETWSDPNIYLTTIGGVQTPVIVMGAGYDSAEDLDVTTGAPNSMGRGVYVINALTGSVIKFLGNTSGGQAGNSAPIVDSITGGIKSAGGLDRLTGMQLLTTAYAADVGGNLWKLDFTSTDPDNWTMTKMATLGGTGTSNRKFLYAPDVVNRTLGYTAVLVGSGDREHPMDTTVQNYFFMVKDYADVTKNTWPLTLTDLPDASVSGAYTGTQPGWRYPLSGSGEKDVGTSVTLSGVVYFNTNVPYGTTWDGNTCTPSLGEARAYTVGLDGTCQGANGACYTVAPGGGFLPSPVPATVDINGKTVTVVISGTQVSKPKQPQYGHTIHQFWYKQGVDQTQ